VQASGARAAFPPQRDSEATAADSLVTPSPGLSPAAYGSSLTRSDVAPQGSDTAFQQPVAPPSRLAEARASAARVAAAPAPANAAGSAAAGGHQKTRRSSRGGNNQRHGPQVRDVSFSDEGVSQPSLLIRDDFVTEQPRCI